MAVMAHRIAIASVLVLGRLVVPGLASGQDFTAQISPNPVMLSAGGETVDVVVTTMPDAGFTASITYSFSGLPAGITTGGPRTVNAPYPPQTFSFSASPGVVPGTYPGTLTGDAAGRIATFPITVVVDDPSFTLSATPAAVTVQPGASRMVSVSATGAGGFRGSVTVDAAAAPGLDVVPATFTLRIDVPQTVMVTAATSATPGPVSVVFTGTAAGVGTESATVAVTIEADPPEPGPGSPPIVTSVAPQAMASGTRDNVILLTGLNFQPGATISSTAPGVQVTGATVLSPTTARVLVSVRPDAPEGRIRLDFRNPDGGTAAGGATVLLYPARALAAPLAVTGVRILTPRPWQIVEPDEPVRARALLATSGTGTVVGTWMLDGIPFDRFTQVVSSGFPVEVESSVPIPAAITGERRLELLVESPGTLPPSGVPFLLAPTSRSAIRLLEPAAESGAEPGERDEPLLRWTLVPGASGYEVEIRDEAADRGKASLPMSEHRVARVTRTSWTPDDRLLAELGPGPIAVRVRAVFPGEVRDDPTDWRLVIRDGTRLSMGPASTSPASMGPSSSAPGPVFAADTRRPSGPSLLTSADRASQRSVPSVIYRNAAPPAAGQGELSVAILGTTTAVESSPDAPPALSRLQVSGQVDTRGPVFDLQSTADLAASQDLEDPWDNRFESQNWLLRAGAAQSRFREHASLGFAPPSFFDQAELLTVTTSSGAFEGGFDSPAGSLSFYRSLDLSGNDAFQAFEPEVNAAGYELSGDGGRYLFRAMLLDATDPGSGDFSPGGEGRALGALGVFDLGPRLRLTGEVATGDFEPGEGSFEDERDGRAFRLGASGASGTVTYAASLGHTGRGFVNPANPGFTPGGVSDRTGGELMLGNTFGRASISGTYRHLRGGVSDAAGDPKTTENGVNVVLSMPVTDVVSLSLSSNLSNQSGDPLENLGLPGTDRTQKGLDLAVTETFGAISLTQSVTLQDFTDRILPLGDQRVTGFSLFGYGAATPYLGISANLSSTRIRSAPQLGTTDQTLVSLQPTLKIERLWIELSPRAAFTRVSNDAFDSESNADQFQVVARWAPEWIDGLIAAEIAGDWRRSWTDLDPQRPPLERQIVFSLTLNRGIGHRWPGGGP